MGKFTNLFVDKAVSSPISTSSSTGKFSGLFNRPKPLDKNAPLEIRALTPERKAQLRNLSPQEQKALDVARNVRRLQSTPEWAKGDLRMRAVAQGILPVAQDLPPDIKKAFPGATFTGQAIGTLATAAPIAKMTARIVPAAERAIPMAKELFPRATKIAANVLHSAVTGTGVGGTREGARQIGRQEFKPVEIAKEAGWTGLEFAPWGIVPATTIGANITKPALTESIKRGAAAAGAVGAGTAGVELLRKHKLDQDSLTNIAINSITAGLLHGYKGNQIAEANKNKEISDFMDRELLTRVKSRNPGMSDEEARVIALTLKTGITKQPAIIERVEARVTKANPPIPREKLPTVIPGKTIRTAQPIAGGQVFSGKLALKPGEDIAGVKVVQTTSPAQIKDVSGRKLNFGANDSIFTYPIVSQSTGKFTGKVMVKDGDKGIVSLPKDLTPEEAKLKIEEKIIGSKPRVELPEYKTAEEFENIPIIKYTKEKLRDKQNPLTVAERNQLAEQMVDQGLMSINDFNAMTGKHGFGGQVTPLQTLEGKPIPSVPIKKPEINEDIKKNIEKFGKGEEKLSGEGVGTLINYIGEWQTFRNAVDFGHRNMILKDLAEGKNIPNKILEHYKGWTDGMGDTGWADRELFKRKYGVQGVTLKKQEINSANKDEIKYTAFNKEGKIIAESDVVPWDKESEAIKQIEGIIGQPVGGELAVKRPVELDNPNIPDTTVPTTDIKKVIAQRISKADVEDAAERFWNVGGREFYDEYKTSKEWLQKEEPSQIALELENRSELYRKYFQQFSDIQYPNEIYPEDIIRAYKSGELRESIVRDREEAPPIEIKAIPVVEQKTFWSPKQAKDINIGATLQKATQRLTKTNSVEVLSARGDLVTLYNTDPHLADKLGIKQGELSKRIKALTGYPSGAPKLEYFLNQGIPPEFQWVGISNSSWINKNTVTPASIDKYFKSIEVKGEGTGFYGDKGETLRRYIINAILGIDTRLLFNDLSFAVESLKARGNYSNVNLTITISDINPNTVAHEIGHYLDYKFARELGLANDTLSRATPNWDYFRGKGTPEEHLKWAQKFKNFTEEISLSSDISSEYRQDIAEVFARFIAKFTSWVNKQATSWQVTDENIYKDKFVESDYRQFIRLLQEKAYIDAKYNIKASVQKTTGKINMDVGNYEKRQAAMQKRLINVDMAKDRIAEINNVRKQFLHRIRKYKKGYLKEELAGFPAKYITVSGGISPDEALQDLRDNYGVDLPNESVLKDYFIGLDKEISELKDIIATNKPKIVARSEATILKREQKLTESLQKKFSGQAKKIIQEAAKVSARLERKAFRAGKVAEAERRKTAYFGPQRSREERSKLYLLAKEKGLYYTDFKGKPHDKLAGILKYYPEASFDQLREYISSLTGDPQNHPKLFKLHGDIVKDTEVIKLLNQVSDKWQDINTLEIHSLDPARIVEKVTQQDLWDDNILADNTFSVYAAADEAKYDRLTRENADLMANKMGIKRGSKESSELMRKFEAGEPLTEKEKLVTTYLRRKYDAFISEANEMRLRLGKKPIPYRRDYMTHILEQNLLSDFFKGDTERMNDISSEQLDAIRKGDYTKGNMPFNRFALRRKGKKTKYDAIGNYEIYLKTILNEIYFTPAITHARKFIEYALVKHPNAYKALDRLANDLKGKPSIEDQNVIGRIASFGPIKRLRSLQAKSALLGNINFWLMNSSNFAISYDELGNYMNKGLAKFIGSKKWRDFAFKHSDMLKGRTIDPDIEPSSFKFLEEAAGYVTNLLEYNNVGSTFVGAYFKGIDLGYSQAKAIKYADNIARRTQVGYKKFELNAWMRSNSGMLLSQFQSWTFNAMNHILYDLGVANLPRNLLGKFTGQEARPIKYGKLLTLVVMGMLLNLLYKKSGLREPYTPGSAMPRIPGLGGAVPPLIRIGQNIGTAFTGKKPETRQKAAMRVGLSFVPGGTQLGRLFTGKLLPDNENNRVETESPAYRYSPKFGGSKFGTTHKFKKRF